jgi:hypothetical protein
MRQDDWTLPESATVNETTGVITWDGAPPDDADELQNDVMREMRRRAYPPLGELGDAIYHEQNGNAAPMAAYLAKCAAVKAAYPLVSP